MNILYVTSEASPFCKTGALADVAGSLPPALAAGRDRVAVILPLYQSVAEGFRGELSFVRWTYVRLAWRSVYCGLFSLKRDGVTWYFIDNEYYFKRPALYGYYDDGERFAFFSRAVTELLPELPEKPDVVHCNDWQSALVPIYIHDEAVRDEFYRGIRTVMTIHSIEHQGRYGRELLGDLFGLAPGWYDGGTLAYDGGIDLLKGAIVDADAVTTLSPTYAWELKHAYFAHGLEGVVSMCEGKLHGVLNGVDESYDPRADASLPAHYSAGRLAGKRKCKEQLQQTLGLQVRPDVPLAAMVTRLVPDKGIDLVCETLDAVMEKDVQFVLLGRGDARYETFFRYAAQRHPGRIAVYLGCSEPLSRQIYAGADLFLMPSRSEPCGLSQMIAMRYGAVPVVRATGGLKDTVRAYRPGSAEGSGFCFTNYAAADLCHSVCEAIDLYHDNPAAFRALQKRAMAEDHSWKRSARAYRAIYQTIGK